MNNILSCDTSTGTLHLALKSDGRMYERMLESFSHSEGLLGQILSILGEAGIGIGDLGLLVCTRGPGSFTSLRIGMATLKGFSLARNIPLVSVPTLEAIAAACPCPGSAALAVIDAKKRRYYLGLYRDGQRLMDDVDGNAGDIADRIAEERNIIVTGPDAPAFYEKLKESADMSTIRLDEAPLRPLGAVLIRLGEKRYAENQAFLAKTYGIRNFFRKQKNIWQQRRVYHIYTCPSCKQKIRIPKGKGKIEVRCPKCGTTFIKKS